MKVTLAQTSPKFLDIKTNLEKAIQIIKENHSDIYIFPELFLSGYNIQSKEQLIRNSMKLNSKEIKKLQEISKKKEIGICGGYAEIYKDNFYNSAFFIGDGQILSNYRKTHLFNNEKDLFIPGNTGFEVFEYKKTKIGIMICYDWIYPESARTLTKKGAQIILHPSNLVLPYCQTAMYTRALENKVFIATVNRVGTEKDKNNNDVHFKGLSQIVNPNGEYILKLEENTEQVKSIDIKPEFSNDKNMTPKNHILNDLRPEYYL